MGATSPEARNCKIMKFFTQTLLFTVLLTTTAYTQLHAAEYDWNNTGTSLNAASSYSTSAGVVETAVPSTTTAAYFKTLTMQPVLNAGLTVAGLNIQVSGFDLTAATTGYGLTLSGYGTTATGTSASSEAAVYSTGTGTNTFDVPVILASSSSGAAPSTVYQTGVGGSLVFNGVISGSTSLAINLPATSTVAFNAANTDTGGTTLTGTNVTGGAATLALGNDAALGTGSLTFASSNATIAATGGARTIPNALVFGTTSTIGGTNNFTFTGTATAANAVARTLTVSNTGTTTFAGNVYLSDVAATGRTLTINGTGAVAITAPIADFNGTGTTGNLVYSGTNTLTLSGANTYSGTTTVGSATVTGGILTVTSSGVLGGGNVTVNNGNTLTLGTGVTNAIADTATLTLGTTASGTNAILALNGTMGTSMETVNGLIVNGAVEPAGKYGSTSDTTAGVTQLANITGAGELTVLTTVTSAVPEPSTWALMVVSLGLLAVATMRSRCHV